MPKTLTTIKDIAETVGVSRGTVDRVVNNRGRVKPEVAQRVQQVMDEMGYVPNKAGKALVTRKNPIKIGCFLPSIGNAFFDEVIRGFRAAELEFRDFGLSVTILEARGYNIDEHVTAIRQLVDDGCNALCVTTLDVSAMRECLREIVDSGIPVIAVNNELSDTGRLCYVGSDYQSGGRTAARLLTMVCHDKDPMLLIVTGSLNVKGHNDRVSSYLDSLSGLGQNYSLLSLCESLDDNDVAYTVTAQALKSYPEINCIYITAGGVGGVCRAVADSGIREQHALRVISFDDPEGTKALIRSGEIDFTICQEPFRQGYESISRMFHYFLGSKKNAPADCLTETVIKIKENL